MVTKGDYLKKIISDQHKSIRFYLFFALGLVLFGVLVILISSMSSGRLIPDAFKGILGIGGGFVSSLSAFPYKEIRSRREKLGMLELVEVDLYSLEQLGDLADADERKRIYAYIDQTVGAILTGRG